MAEKVTHGARVATNPLFKDSRTINDTLAMLDRYRQTAVGTAASPRFRTPSTDVVYVKNTTGADRALGDVVQLGTYLLDDIDQDNFWFECSLPAFPIGKIAILRAPAAVNDIVPASVSGCWIAKVSVTATGDRFCKPQRANSALLSDASGGPIELLSYATSTGEQILPVRFHQNFLAKGKLTGDLAFEGSQTVRVWRRNSSNVEAAVSPTEDVVAYDWMLESGYELTSNSRVVIAFMDNDVWYVIASANCPTVA